MNINKLIKNTKKLSKQTIEQHTEQILLDAKTNDSEVEVLIQANALKKIASSIESALKDDVINMVHDGDFVLPANVSLSIQNRTTYNFSDDQVWNELNHRIEELKLMLKAREQYLKNAQTKYQTSIKKIYDPETGEEVPKLDFDVKQVMTVKFN